MRERLVGAAESRHREPEVAVDLGPRVEIERGLEVRGRGVDATQLDQGKGEVVVRLRLSGVDRQRALVLRRRLLVRLIISLLILKNFLKIC